ncbi:hypothetical protein KHM83_13830 [Fusibacter paucivorans]|uniref:Uncharacterized protein n=1 Tax=Fusibacter paucivorans TaxID=76009 RepID=A0ABS5PRH7_9FIRM|nr:hypothetical protein [Fusibacter paucivorans]MBS7527759.1 hypothetical protein [Fusibacter paucivorans]
MSIPKKLSILNCFDYYLPLDFFYEKIHCLDQYHVYVKKGIISEVEDENGRVYFSLDKTHFVHREPSDSEYAVIVAYYQSRISKIKDYDTFVEYKYSLINLIYFAAERSDINLLFTLISSHFWMLYKWESANQLMILVDLLKSRNIAFGTVLNGYLEGLSNTEIFWEAKISKKHLKAIIDNHLLTLINQITAPEEALQKNESKEAELALNALNESEAYLLFAYFVSNTQYQEHLGSLQSLEVINRYIGFYRLMMTTPLSTYLSTTLDARLGEDPFYAYLFIAYYFNRVSNEWTPEMPFDVNAFVEGYSRCIRLAKLLEKEADYFFMLFVAIITRFAQFKAVKLALDVLVRVSTIDQAILNEEDRQFIMAVIGMLSGDQASIRLTGIYKTYFSAIEKTLEHTGLTSK